MHQGKIRDMWRRLTGLPHDVPSESNLNLGVASVHALNLLTELEDQFGGVVSDEEFVSATSLAILTSLMMEPDAKRLGSIFPWPIPGVPGHTTAAAFQQRDVCRFAPAA
jgi:acyl carrier protein